MAICDHCRNTLYVKEIDKKNAPTTTTMMPFKHRYFSHRIYQKIEKKLGKPNKNS